LFLRNEKPVVIFINAFFIQKIGDKIQSQKVSRKKLLKDFCKKGAHKMLMKLTPGVNFINMLTSRFWAQMFWQGFSFIWAQTLRQGIYLVPAQIIAITNFFYFHPNKCWRLHLISVCRNRWVWSSCLTYNQSKAMCLRDSVASLNIINKQKLLNIIAVFVTSQVYKNTK